jgi:hypothetical protein
MNMSDRGARAGVLLIAASFGVTAGLLEGLTATILRGMPGFANRVSPEILWVAPAVNLALFLLVGGTLGLGFRLVGRTPPLWVLWAYSPG